MENLITFKQQIADDIKLIQDNYPYRKRYDDANFVFNHWLLDKIFSLDEESTEDNITDRSGDGKIDCFVHYEDEKELYIIQSKYYNQSSLTVDKITKFLLDPIVTLNKGDYHNSELQNVYTKAKTDLDYRIYLYLYSTEENFSASLYEHINNFNNEHSQIEAKIVDLPQLHRLYYREDSHGNKDGFTFSMKQVKKTRFLDFGKEEGLMNDKFKAKYIVVSIVDIWRLRNEAKEDNYDLFDENIRNYLGDSRINKKIKNTLKNKEDRKNFFFYNNGITITCLTIEKAVNSDNIGERGYQPKHDHRDLVFRNPQIINGCQTVNSIFDVLEADKANIDSYKDTFVLMKVLDFDSGSIDNDKELYKRIVESTNNQNAIKPTDFAKNADYFEAIRKGFEDRGALLEVKRSDITKYKSIPYEKRTQLLSELNRRYSTSITRQESIFSLEKLILLYLCHTIDGQAAFQKKKDILNQNNDYFKNYSLKLDNLTHDTLIRIYLLYIKAEKDKKETAKNSKDKLIPYYMFSFIGSFLKRNEETNYYQKINAFYEKVV